MPHFVIAQHNHVTTLTLDAHGHTVELSHGWRAR